MTYRGTFPLAMNIGRRGCRINFMLRKGAFAVFQYMWWYCSTYEWYWCVTHQRVWESPYDGDIQTAIQSNDLRPNIATGIGGKYNTVSLRFLRGLWNRLRALAFANSREGQDILHLLLDRREAFTGETLWLLDLMAGFMITVARE